MQNLLIKTAKNEIKEVATNVTTQRRSNGHRLKILLKRRKKLQQKTKPCHREVPRENFKPKPAKKVRQKAKLFPPSRKRC